ncbi:MAG: hypothetical protein BWK78_05535 [Thiotrichaceae bacterium IS1]|nr:MAG: hypothetical protein BWK78_05535 [Thiotrichaceae bacterium IS1]
MYIIVVKQNFIKTCYQYVARTIVVPSVAAFLLLLAGVPYAAYDYSKSHKAKSTRNAERWMNMRRGVNEVANRPSLTGRSSEVNLDTISAQLQSQASRLNIRGKQLLSRQRGDSLSWEEIIAQDSGASSKQKQAISQRLAKSAPIRQVVKLSPNSSLTSVSEDDLSDEEDSLIENIVLNHRSGLQRFPAGWPAKVGYVSSNYGWRGRRMHKGIDIAVKHGSQVLAVEDGTVTYAGTKRGYGNIIIVKHSDTYSTRYAHNSKNLVAVGDFVKKGAPVSLAGATGRATGVHIHFEIRQLEVAINPTTYLSVIGRLKLSDNIRLANR